MTSSTESTASSKESTASSTELSRGTHPLAYVLAGGLVVGTLDIVFAMTFWAWRADVPALRVLQSIAAGVLGPASFEGGLETATLGLTLHYLIALSMAVVYYVAARRWPALWRRAVPWGTVYGLLLYGIMNLVVVPLSASPAPGDSLWVVFSVPVHVLLIGIPIALFVRQGIIQQDPPEGLSRAPAAGPR